jgi:hypothetical protein
MSRIGLRCFVRRGAEFQSQKRLGGRTAHGVEPRAGCKAVARPPHVYQLLLVVVAENQCVEAARTRRVAADDEFLPLIDTHLPPRAGAQARLVRAVLALGDEALETMGPDGFQKVAKAPLCRELGLHEGQRHAILRGGLSPFDDA